MEFKRINETTINCIVSVDDMDEMGVSTGDILNRSDVAMNMIKEILDKASNEVNYTPAGGVLPMQILILGDGSLSITLSENGEIDFRKVLEEITSSFGVRLPERLLREIGEAPEEKRIEIVKEFTQNLKEFTQMFNELLDHNKSKQGLIGDKRAQQGKRKAPEYLYSFDSMSEVISLCKQIPESLVGDGILYKNNKNGNYILRVDLQNDADPELVSMFSLGYEYGTLMPSQTNMIASIEEHSDILIGENAIAKLRKM